MNKVVKVVNVGYFSNMHAKDQIAFYEKEGYGIDALAEHPVTRETWVTFYKYETGREAKPKKSFMRRLIERHM
jgi:hypothetical protein